jgi:hypothetical protein
VKKSAIRKTKQENIMIIVTEGIRFDTEKMTELVGEQNNESEGAGVTLIGIFQSVKSKKILVVTDSIWAKGNSGEIVGLTGHVAEKADVARLAEKYRELEFLVPADE